MGRRPSQCQYWYRECLVTNKQIVTIHDLRHHDWKDHCEQTASETYKFNDWFTPDDPDRQRDAAQLLRYCLESFVRKIDVGKGMRFSHKDKCLYFVLPDNEQGLSATIEGENRRSKRDLVKAAKRGTPPKIVGFKHVGFKSQFHNFDGRWHLELTPNNYYSNDDGNSRRRNSDELRKGIKKIERNQSVYGHINMWNHFLGQKAQSDFLTTSYEHLSFDRAATFDCKYSIIDKAWRPDAADDPDNVQDQVDKYEELAL